MPLTQKIPFKTAVQRGNRLQIPKLRKENGKKKKWFSF
jgi:hypothetical protein